MGPVLVGIMGPTASGKTDLAEQIAERLDAILINADAFQIYRGMDIGTAKPTDRSRYTLLDIRDPDQSFGVGEWVQLAHRILQDAWASSRNAVVVGGTGLNIRALFEQYSGMMGAPDPSLRNNLNARLEQEGLSNLVEELRSLDAEAFQTVDIANPVRVIRAIERAKGSMGRVRAELPPFRRVKLALEIPTDEINARIESRVNVMVQNGWSLEIQRLRDEGYGPKDPGFRAIGYRSMEEVAQGGKDLNEAIAETVLETRRYAKRQRTWLRSEPNLLRIDASAGSEPYRQAVHFLAMD